MSALLFQDVSKLYPARQAGQGTFKALDGINLRVEEGEFFGLLGPNGAGKTTLISILAGLARASSGSVQVHGHDVQADFAQARRLLGVLSPSKRTKASRPRPMSSKVCSSTVATSRPTSSPTLTR